MPVLDSFDAGLLVPAGALALMSSLLVFASTTLPRSHRPVRRIDAVGINVIAFSFVLPWNAPGAVGYSLFGCALLIGVIAAIARIRFQRIYIWDRETHFCYPCGQMQIPGEEPTVCPECGSSTFFRLPPNADNMDRQLAFFENEKIKQMRWAVLHATWPRAILLSGLLMPVALLCISVGRSFNDAGFWFLIAAMWTLAAMTGAHLVTLGVRSPADKETP